MKYFTQAMMIMCYMYVGIWLQRSISEFVAGDTSSGWIGVVWVALFSILGAFNMAIVKMDAKKEVM